MQTAIKICIRNEGCRRYDRLRGLSVASGLRLRLHSDDVSIGYVTLYASTHKDALSVVNLTVNPHKNIFIVSVNVFWRFVLI
jgi:hypothetical protein